MFVSECVHVWVGECGWVSCKNNFMGKSLSPRCLLTFCHHSFLFIYIAKKKKTKQKNVVVMITKYRNKPSGLVLSKKPYISEDAEVGVS